VGGGRADDVGLDFESIILDAGVGNVVIGIGVSGLDVSSEDHPPVWNEGAGADRYTACAAGAAAGCWEPITVAHAPAGLTGSDAGIAINDGDDGRGKSSGLIVAQPPFFDPEGLGKSLAAKGAIGFAILMPAAAAIFLSSFSPRFLSFSFRLSTSS